MAQFGIRSASKALSATTGNDTIRIGGVGSTNLSAQTVFGADGNDIIDIGTVGLTATLTAIINIKSGAGASGASALVTGIVGGPGGSQFTAVVTATGGAGASAATGVATGILTADAGITTASKLQLKGQAGHDTVVFGSSLATLTSAYIGGGQGNDYIGGGSFINDEYTAGSGALGGGKLINTTIFGGKGQDTINLEGNAVFSAGKVNGYEDNDTIKFQAGSATNYFIGGGKGNDTISGDFNKLYTSSVVGGQGQDSLILADIGSAKGVVIAADALDRSNTSANGADSIYISGAVLTSTIQGGAGNDSLTIALSAASGNTVYLDAGNDLVSAIAGTDISNSTFYFGGGDDKFLLADTGTVNSGTKLIMGAGDDTVTLSALAMESGRFAGLTIRGGAGADYLLESTNIATGATAEPIIEFQTSTDSTLTAGYDTIALDAGSGQSADYTFNFVPGSLVRGSFSANGVTASAGKVTFTGTFDAAVTARAEKIVELGATNDTYAFADGAGNSFLFIMGASGQTIAQVGSAAITGDVQDASLTITDGSRINLSIGGAS